MMPRLWNYQQHFQLCEHKLQELNSEKAAIQILWLSYDLSRKFKPW